MNRVWHGESTDGLKGVGVVPLEWLQWLQWSPAQPSHPQLLDVVWCRAAVAVVVV